MIILNLKLRLENIINCSQLYSNYVYFSKSTITLHVYLNPHLAQLNEFLEEENLSLLDRPLSMETVGVVQINYWLIQLSNGTTHNEIKNLFKLSQLRYDTMAFYFRISPSK